MQDDELQVRLPLSTVPNLVFKSVPVEFTYPNP